MEQSPVLPSSHELPVSTRTRGTVQKVAQRGNFASPPGAKAYRISSEGLAGSGKRGVISSRPQALRGGRHETYSRDRRAGPARSVPAPVTGRRTAHRSGGCVCTGDGGAHSAAQRQRPVQFAQSGQPAKLPVQTDQRPRGVAAFDTGEDHVLRPAGARQCAGECPVQQSRRCRADDHRTARHDNGQFQACGGGSRSGFRRRIPDRGARPN